MLHTQIARALKTSSPNLIGWGTDFYQPQGKVESFVYKVPDCCNEKYQGKTSCKSF